MDCTGIATTELESYNVEPRDGDKKVPLAERTRLLLAPRAGYSNSSCREVLFCVSILLVEPYIFVYW